MLIFVAGFLCNVVLKLKYSFLKFNGFYLDIDIFFNFVSEYIFIKIV
ncbi:Hypothetical protein Ccan_21350 [Capnocytophaga canimorsus Cc5]|uniref:Uncharacterized protein n=2 Tax=Capnocytophaga canimorsus TaxID=28188 RepID=F9YUL4_CAPCC|nr:Hypothetical protein Ccan_21350 [Capnocytophaga canimorsus Cc5]CEN48607.1 conserved hypothetical protein [Capnocytophaga canimorsus]